MLGNVAIPVGAIYPDGLPMTSPNPIVQASVRPMGSFFAKSAGYATIRPGRSKFQDPKGYGGIQFTPARFAENLSMPTTLPIMVDVSTAPDHVDIADIPGSVALTEDGNLSNQEERILAGNSDTSAPVGGMVQHRGSKTLPDMGDREPHRPLSQIAAGLSNPVQLFRGEYQQNPLLAVGIAGAVVAVAYMIGRDFDRSYRTRDRQARRGGGVLTDAAPVAAAPAAAADTSGNVVVKTADTAVAVVEEAVEAVGDAVEAVATGVSDAASTAADAVTS